MKPMLATATDGTNLRYPLMISPKLDGVRCIIINGVAMSRSLKPIPNKYVQHLFGRTSMNGFDGELIVGPPGARDVYNQTMSGVMSIEGEPNVKFYVFDDFSQDNGFLMRFRAANYRMNVVGFTDICRLVPHALINDAQELLNHEETYLGQGYEGAMLRDPDGKYKHGRSSLKEGWLLKLKRFEDAEAEIIGFNELMSNTNEAIVNELGQKARSSKKAGMVAAGVLGSLQVRDIKTGVEFEIGTGFDADQRRQIWNERTKLLGQLVKYKSQPVGVKDKPRFPVFLWFRDRIDM